MNAASVASRWKNLAPYAGLVLLGAAALLVPQLFSTSKMTSLATSALIFAIAGAGLGFLWGQCGQLTLAHAAVFGIGAYAAAIGAKHLALTFAMALPLSIAAGLVSGALVALPSLRTGGHYFVILTFAIGEVISVIEMRWESLTGGINGITTLPGDQRFLGLSLADRGDFYRVVVLLATATFLLLYALVRSRSGYVMRAMRENADLATSLGVNIQRYRLAAFAVAGAVAGLAGQLHLYHVKFIAPDLFTSQLSILFLLVVLLGGKFYLLGPLVGSVVYVFMPEFIGFSPIRSQIVFGCILIAMILMAPNGLLGLLRYRRPGRNLPLPVEVAQP